MSFYHAGLHDTYRYYVSLLLVALSVYVRKILSLKLAHIVEHKI